MNRIVFSKNSIDVVVVSQHGGVPWRIFSTIEGDKKKIEEVINEKPASQGGTLFYTAYWLRAVHVAVTESYSEDPIFFNTRFLGRAIFEDITQKSSVDWSSLLFKIRAEYDDWSLLDHYLTPEIVAKLLLMFYAPEFETAGYDKLESRLKVQGYAETHFLEIKAGLFARCGIGQFPYVRVSAVIPSGPLQLEQVDIALWMDLQCAKEVVRYCAYLWGGDVTTCNVCSPFLFLFGRKKFEKQFIQIYANYATGKVSFDTEPSVLGPAQRKS